MHYVVAIGRIVVCCLYIRQQHTEGQCVNIYWVYYVSEWTMINQMIKRTLNTFTLNIIKRVQWLYITGVNFKAKTNVTCVLIKKHNVEK